MTLIAVFTTNHPVLLSDVLLSSNQSIVPTITPMSVPIDPHIYDNAPFRPSHFQQKTAILHEGKIAVAVAGDFIRAQQAVCQLRDDVRGGTVDQAGLETWCRDATKKFKHVALIIVWVEGPQWVVGRIGDNMMQKNTRSGAVVHYTGSGSNWFKSSSVSIGAEVEHIGEKYEADRLIMQAIAQSGMQLFSERSIGVCDNFGGGCQITQMVDSKFYYVRNITYLHWSIFHTPEGAPTIMEFYPVIVRQRQQGSDMVFETIRINPVQCSKGDSWTVYRGQAIRQSQKVAPLITGSPPASEADRFDVVNYYHVQTANYWKGMLVDFKASVMLHVGDVDCPVELDTEGDEVLVRIRNETLMYLRRRSKFRSNWKKIERRWIAARRARISPFR
ncbi:MAG: hypothetical protein LKE94_04695 [Acetobacter fabarum]|jgi:hypothetical protein|uniref:hypothetical protein n=1 Tax=Acetobacter fabarum TaxID=483199 RepID=UPI00242C4F11|nr:hypothetical protein [Acetobacter fabarum]MCH4026449.1 hypothetical protein [Acetobacter fabarum]MCH4085689.1 hypothetical protein [Acetobacter fabarum]MCH4137068.1 hypothetical protein [Acetobacter fabarum]